MDRSALRSLLVLAGALFGPVAALVAMAAAPPGKEIRTRADLPAAGPSTVVVVAADTPASGDVVRVARADAIGGAIAFPPGNYRPIVRASLPPVGDPLFVWVRYTGLALQMKAETDAGQVEFAWNWDRKTEGLGWRRLAPLARAALGRGILFIAAPAPAGAGGIDVVVVTSDASFRPDGSAPPLPGAANEEDAVVQPVAPPPESVDAPGTATVRIDWSRPLGTIPAAVYSINSYAGFDPAVTGNATYRDNLAHLNPQLIRLHYAGLLNDRSRSSRAWFDDAAQDWDYARIRAALGSGVFAGRDVLINLSSWPQGWDADGNNRLDPDRWEDYGRLAARLVRFLRRDLGVPVRYAELTNEKDGPYWVTPSRSGQDFTAELAALYLRVAQAVRAAEPEVLLGGPAAMRPDFYDHLERFVRATRSHLDFLSVHAYASGSTTDSDASIYGKIESMARHATRLAEILRAEIPERAVELHLNEWNISWTWQTREPRMVNHKGAVFDALGFIRFAQVPGLTATNTWNDADGIYGKMSAGPGFTLRPSAHVSHHFNGRLRGERVASEVAPSEAVVALAVRQADGRPAFVLVNRSNAEQSVTLEAGAGDAPWEVAIVDADGHRRESPEAWAAARRLAPHSVTFFWR